jgi:3-deoxy-D-manno-octulosonate 8-phosphate phosphatase (KDO 8-P phosphatase)
MPFPKLVFTDIDGVWTDGGMHYGANGVEYKRFNTSDSAGVLFLKQLEVPLVIITGETTRMVADRAAKLGIQEVHQGVRNKRALAEEIAARHRVPLSECAHIGDDLNDIALLKAVGHSACPKNAPPYVAKHAQYHLPVRGGDGAFRCFIELLLEANGMLDAAVERYLADQSSALNQ